jgi:hypothetical protein
VPEAHEAAVAAFTDSMNAGMFFFSPISSSMNSTASFAPPCSGPYSAAMPAETAENGSTCEEPTLRTALVEQFCSWSACRISRISRARCSTGWARAGRRSRRSC